MLHSNEGQPISDSARGQVQGEPGAPPGWVGYAVAVLLQALLGLGLLLLEPYFPLGHYPIMFVLTVIAAAYLFGVGPAVVAFLVGLVIFLYIFLPLRLSIQPVITTAMGWAGLTAYIIGSWGGGAMALAVRRSQMRIRQLAGGLRESNESLRMEIAERTRTEQELSEERDRAEQAASSETEARATLQAILDTVPTGVVLADAGGRISYYSPGAVEVLGGPVTGTAAGPEPGGYKLLRSDGSPFPADELPLVRSIRHGERMCNVELLVQRADGSEVTILASSAPIRDGAGRITGAVVGMTNVTEISRLRRKLEEALEKEQHFSKLLQRALLPEKPEIGAGYRMACAYVPAFATREIGGDFYDVFTMQGGKSAILIGDVSGKGLEAASLAAATRSTVRAFAFETPSPGEAVTRGNAVIYFEQPGDNSFVTVLLVILDLPSGEFRYCNAGHPPPAIYRADGSVEFLPTGQPPVGIEPAREFEEFSGRLGPADKLMLYTDGISEARRDNKMFGLRGIEHALRGYGHLAPEEIVGELLAAAVGWAKGRLTDDAVVLIVERT